MFDTLLLKKKLYFFFNADNILELKKVYDEKKSQINATNRKTGELIVIAHVAVDSQSQLNKNLRTKNASGSRFVGIMNNGGGSKGYIHAHITIYKNAAGRQSILKQQYLPNGEGGYVSDQRGWSDFRNLLANNKQK